MNRTIKLFMGGFLCLLLVIHEGCTDDSPEAGEKNKNENSIDSQTDTQNQNETEDSQNTSSSTSDTDSDTDIDTDTDADTDNDEDSDSDGAPEGSIDSITEKCNQCGGFNGVDMLLVVDNSTSMEQEQGILATGIFTLLNSLLYPTEKEGDDGPQANVRLAVVSTDMGLQYGENGSTEGWPYNDFTKALKGCDESPSGDNGKFQTTTGNAVRIRNGSIPCSPGAKQCPSDKWECKEGKCVLPENENDDTCESHTADTPWTATSNEDENRSFAKQVACNAQLGIDGCGIEQQLQAGLKGLVHDSQKSFLKEDHLLSIIVISDEEDCSIRDKALFDSPEWLELETLNTACTLPAENEERFLFDPSFYHDELVKIKGGNENAVVFAAIVGVPLTKPEDDNNCQGPGIALGDCLAHPKMEYKKEYSDEYDLYLFEPACTRTSGDRLITSAAPGRRYVKLAQQFGCHGYVFSICNKDWSPAMENIADLLKSCIV